MKVVLLRFLLVPLFLSFLPSAAGLEAVGRPCLPPPSPGANVVTDKAVYAIGEEITILMCVNLPNPPASIGQLTIFPPAGAPVRQWHVFFYDPTFNPGNTASKTITASEPMGNWTIVFFAMTGFGENPSNVTNNASASFVVQNALPEFYSTTVTIFIVFTLAVGVSKLRKVNPHKGWPKFH